MDNTQKRLFQLQPLSHPKLLLESIPGLKTYQWQLQGLGDVARRHTSDADLDSTLRMDCCYALWCRFYMIVNLPYLPYTGMQF